MLHDKAIMNNDKDIEGRARERWVCDMCEQIEEVQDIVD